MSLAEMIFLALQCFARVWMFLNVLECSWYIDTRYIPSTSRYIRVLANVASPDLGGADWRTASKSDCHPGVGPWAIQQIPNNLRRCNNVVVKHCQGKLVPLMTRLRIWAGGLHVWWGVCQQVMEQNCYIVEGFPIFPSQGDPNKVSEHLSHHPIISNRFSCTV